METKKEKEERKASGKLPDEVAKKFSVPAGLGIGICMHKTKQVDLRTITVEEATALVADGFGGLIAKKAEPSTEAKK